MWSILFLIFLSFLLFLYFQNIFTDISLSLVVEFVIATFVLHFINFRSRSPLLIKEIRAHFGVVFLGSLLSIIRPFCSTTAGYLSHETMPLPISDTIDLRSKHLLFNLALISLVRVTPNEEPIVFKTSDGLTWYSS